MRKTTILMVGIILAMSFTSGCSKPTEQKSQSTIQNTTTVRTTTQNTTTQTADKIEYLWKGKLYFPDNNAMYIVGEEREMKAVTDGTDKVDIAAKAKIMLEEMIKGPKTKDLSASIPKNTNVLSVVFENGTMVVDLSREFVDESSGGSTGEIMALGPIVLALTELEGVKQVSIKIEGKQQTDFKGHFTLDKPLKRAEFEQYIKK